MADTKAFLLPDLGEGLPDATIVEWMVKPGDTILLDAPLVSMETAKAVVEVPSPVSGKVLKLLPHAYVIMTADNVGVLVHLGLDTVALEGEGFTTHVSQGDEVTAGQTVTTYDVPAIVAKGLNPVVPVVVMDEREPGNITPDEAVLEGAVLTAGDGLFTAGT